MDDQLRELLSRQLDGDLDDEERRRLERAAADDPTVGEALRGLGQVRAAVRRLADSEAPPRQLDEVLSPLRRAAPSAPRGARWSWLAAAASIVLGVTAAYHLVGQRPAPERTAARSPSAAGPSRPGYYQLQPVPRFVGPDGRQMRGSADRLAATPRAPAAGTAPPALEVVGPLAEDPAAGQADAAERGGRDERDAAVAGSLETPGGTASSAEAPPPGGRLEITLDGRTFVLHGRRALPSVTGWVEVAVEAGRVTTVGEAAGPGQLDVDGLGAVRPVLQGAVLAGVPDGFHRARVVGGGRAVR